MHRVAPLQRRGMQHGPTSRKSRQIQNPSSKLQDPYTKLHTAHARLVSFKSKASKGSLGKLVWLVIRVRLVLRL